LPESPASRRSDQGRGTKNDESRKHRHGETSPTTAHREFAPRAISGVHLDYCDLDYCDLGYCDLGYGDLGYGDLGYGDLGSCDLAAPFGPI
jgi:hypothetical protein